MEKGRQKTKQNKTSEQLQRNEKRKSSECECKVSVSYLLSEAE